jgi:3-methyladenine DNA glycosylase AlkD
MTFPQLQKDLEKCSDPVKAENLSRFFKTGPGEYGEHDLFRGISVPQIRELTQKHLTISFQETITLLHSPYHEDRLCALLMFVKKIKTADDKLKQMIYEAYLLNTRYINNWDLVDSSAEHIVGYFLFDKSRAPLYALVKSPILWERRIAILSTFHYIKKSSFEDALNIIEQLLNDKEDLIHKAIGWMLREIGKKDRQVEEQFLKSHYKKLPRTSLRYAIERFPEELRKNYLRGVF